MGEPPRSTNLTGPGLIGEPVTLDFVNVDVRDVVRSVLGDVLKLSYAIDPAVQGAVTLQTAAPLARPAVLPALEAALRLSNVAIVQQQGIFKVIPLANASREAQLGAAGGAGVIARVVTPRYVSAVDLQRVLEPMVPPGTSLRAEPSRNVLIVSGPSQDVTTLLDDLAIFDVDGLRGLSFALLPLRTAGARDVAKEVINLLGSLGGTGGLVRVTPIERLNALLVTSMQPAYLDRVRRWVERLDQGGGTTGSAGQQLFVYRVQNGRAADLAGVLRKALGIAGSEPETSSAAGAGGGSGGSSPYDGSGGSGGSAGSSSNGEAPPAALGGRGGAPNVLLGGLPGTQGATGIPQGASAAPLAPEAGGPAGGASPSGSDIRITADETNNALLVMATSQEYATVQSALRQLDIIPLQVLIEATVAEVTLNNQLIYGLNYYVRSGDFQALFASGATGGTDPVTPNFNFVPGLNLALTTGSSSAVVLQLLQKVTDVRVLSSPNLLVLNNQSARIQVGDQVPIATGSAVSTLSGNAPIVNSIEYRDTGVILKVTPRVNASGVVALDISEEVSDVSTTTSSGLDSPTISERRLNSSVSVGDGQTIALGGLIRDARSRGKNGIPILQDIPYLGWLFGTRDNSSSRTELIALITPHVVRDPASARAVTEELQRKLPLTLPVTRGTP